MPLVYNNNNNNNNKNTQSFKPSQMSTNLQNEYDDRIGEKQSCEALPAHRLVTWDSQSATKAHYSTIGLHNAQQKHLGT